MGIRSKNILSTVTGFRHYFLKTILYNALFSIILLVAAFGFVRNVDLSSPDPLQYSNISHIMDNFVVLVLTSVVSIYFSSLFFGVIINKNSDNYKAVVSSGADNDASSRADFMIAQTLLVYIYSIISAVPFLIRLLTNYCYFMTFEHKLLVVFGHITLSLIFPTIFLSVSFFESEKQMNYHVQVSWIYIPWFIVFYLAPSFTLLDYFMSSGMQLVVLAIMVLTNIFSIRYNSMRSS